MHFLLLSKEQVPWFTVDLDAPPREHYKQVVAPYIDSINAVIANIKDVAHTYIGSIPLFEFLEILSADAFTNKLPKNYREEIQAILLKTKLFTGNFGCNRSIRC